MKPRKVAFVLGGTALLLGCIWYAHLIFRFWHPSADEARDFFASYPALPREARAAEVERFFSSNSRSICDSSEFSEYVFEQFAKAYRETTDEALLVGLDRVQLDTHFGEVMCGFYRDVVKIPEAVQHYRTPAGAARLRGCRGEWSAEELRRFLGPLADANVATPQHQ